jgi:hypothetical protein
MIQYELYYATLPPMERKITLKVWRVMRPPRNFWRDALELTMLKNLTLGVKSEFWGLDMWKLYSMS